MDIQTINQLINESNEDDFLIHMSRESFFNLIEKSEIDLDKLASKKKKSDYLPFHRFNFLLKKIHKQRKLDITDACLLLLKECYDINEVMGSLNEENKYLLRVSLAERFNIKLKRTTLDLFEKKRKKSS